MKKNIIITLLLSLFLYTNSYSQNNEPSQRTFTFGGNTQTISSTLDYFKINKFTLGWHWGDQFKISKALKMNQVDISSVDNGNINPETNLFIRSQKNGKFFWSHTYFDNHAIFGKSLKYDPVLNIDPNNVYKLNKRPNDPSNPVFGFREIHNFD